MFQQFNTPDGPKLVHLNTVKPPRVVPGNERHKWNGKVARPGQTATCSRCGCVKTIESNYGDWLDSFQMPGQPAQRSRPACTGGTGS